MFSATSHVPGTVAALRFATAACPRISMASAPSYLLRSSAISRDRRSYSLSKSLLRKRGGRIESPYAALGLPATSSFDEVRRAFVKLALRHHPDVTGTKATDCDSDNDDDDKHGSFIRIRQAFETIRNDILDHGRTRGGLRDKNETSASTSFEGWSAEELREWYRQETGEWLAFDMCDQTRKEVIHAYRTMSQGGKDMGGHWEMARQLAEREDARLDFADGDSGPMKQLTGSPVSPGAGTDIRRRPRRR